MSLLDALDGARMVVVDEERRLAFAWFGGAGINVYDEDGNEVHYFTMGADRITPEVVRSSVRSAIAAWDEEDDED